MLDQLRAMGVFACVVKKRSFSGAARDLGITTSAVSQQIRALELGMDVTLLHRSTRKLSLTEAGQAFFYSCQEMLAAAERGKNRLNELRDELVGDLRIATTSELGATHLVPALSDWISAHRGLTVHFEANTHFIDLIQERIDIAIRMCGQVEELNNLTCTPLADVEQILVASASYLNQKPPIARPEDLIQHDLIPINVMKDIQFLSFKHVATNEIVNIEMRNHMQSNDVLITKALCQNGHGIARILYLDVQKELLNGTLVQVLPEWKLPAFTLNAITVKCEQQPIKIERCLETLKQYFNHLPTGRALEEV